MGPEWQLPREPYVITVMKDDIMIAIQKQNAIAQRTAIGCFEQIIIMTHLFDRIDSCFELVKEFVSKQEL